jgi:hypothetical protein
VGSVLGSSHNLQIDLRVSNVLTVEWVQIVERHMVCGSAHSSSIDAGIAGFVDVRELHRSKSFETADLTFAVKFLLLKLSDLSRTPALVHMR